MGREQVQSEGEERKAVEEDEGAAVRGRERHRADVGGGRKGKTREGGGGGEAGE